MFQIFRQDVSDLFGSLSYILCFTIYISLFDNSKYTLWEVFVYCHRFLISKAYIKIRFRRTISVQGSQVLSAGLWMLKFGSRILNPGSWVLGPRCPFQTMLCNSAATLLVQLFYKYKEMPIMKILDLQLVYPNCGTPEVHCNLQFCGNQSAGILKYQTYHSLQCNHRSA